MFREKLINLAQTHERCVIFTPFGLLVGTVKVCDGEAVTFRSDFGNEVICYVEDVQFLSTDPKDLS